MMRRRCTYQLNTSEQSETIAATTQINPLILGQCENCDDKQLAHMSLRLVSSVPSQEIG